MVDPEEQDDQATAVRQTRFTEAPSQYADPPRFGAVAARDARGKQPIREDSESEAPRTTAPKAAKATDAQSGYSFSIEESDESAFPEIPEDFMVYVSQREDVSAGVPATIANIKTLSSVLLRWIEEDQCYVLHFGGYKDYETARALLEQHDVSAWSPADKERAPERTVESGIEFLTDEWNEGRSVLHHAIKVSDLTDAGRIMAGLTLEAPKNHDEGISIGPSGKNTRFIILLDISGTFAISKRILNKDTDEEMYTYTADQEKGRKKISYSIEGKYRPQVSSSEVVRPGALCGPWETAMKIHVFRNSFYPSLFSEEKSHPLTGLAVLASVCPFSKVSLLGVTLVSERGELTKKLLEAWLNYVLGTPLRYITLS